jgi:hypothetical protein
MQQVLKAAAPSSLDLKFIMDQNWVDLLDSDEPLPSKSTLNVTELLTGREYPSPNILKIALLTSFPNSGTSYTLSTVKRASNRAIATNHCEKDSIIPVYDESVIAGPHLTGTSLNMSLPESYILTKTHCAGYCVGCAPSRYVKTQQEFRAGCLQECAFQKSAGTFRKATVQYDPLIEMHDYSEEQVGKVVHLVRSPFTNIISRFHKHLHGAEASVTHKSHGKYDYTADSFQQYCFDLDQNYTTKEKQTFGRKIFRLAKKIPCRSEFFRYVQWHNNAFRLNYRLEKKYGTESLVLHYEDYSERFNITMDSVLSFLELSQESDPLEFHLGRYDDYYTKSQQQSIQDLIAAMASKETWEIMGRYGFHDTGKMLSQK